MSTNAGITDFISILAVIFVPVACSESDRRKPSLTRRRWSLWQRSRRSLQFVILSLSKDLNSVLAISRDAQRGGDPDFDFGVPAAWISRNVRRWH